MDSDPRLVVAEPIMGEDWGKTQNLLSNESSGCVPGHLDRSLERVLNSIIKGI